MSVSLGEAWRLGWRVRVRCLLIGPHHKSGHRPGVRCDTAAELDLRTLVWTRGDQFPVEQLHTRLMCPVCGNRAIRVFFDVPGRPKGQAARAQ